MGVLFCQGPFVLVSVKKKLLCNEERQRDRDTKGQRDRDTEGQRQQNYYVTKKNI
jgi:hypothetical protein